MFKLFDGVKTFLVSPLPLNEIVIWMEETHEEILSTGEEFSHFSLHLAGARGVAKL